MYMQLLVLVKEILSSVTVPNFYFCTPMKIFLKLFDVLVEYGQYVVAHIHVNECVHS